MAIDFPEITDAPISDGQGRRTRETVDSITAEILCGSAETADLVRSAIGGLTLQHKAVILGRYYDGLTFEELGEELGISKPAAFKLHARACERLKISLELMGVTFHALSFT